MPNFLIFDKFSSLHNNVKLYKRDYSNFNPQDMISEFQSINSISYFFDNIHDSKKIWKGVKQIVNFKPPTSAKHIELRVNDRKIASPIEVANDFQHIS